AVRSSWRCSARRSCIEPHTETPRFGVIDATAAPARSSLSGIGGYPRVLCRSGHRTARENSRKAAKAPRKTQGSHALLFLGAFAALRELFYSDNSRTRPSTQRRSACTVCPSWLYCY